MENFAHTSFACAKQPNSIINVAINYLLARHVSYSSYLLKKVKKLMDEFNQYTPKLIVWLTHLVWKRKDHVYVLSR